MRSPADVYEKIVYWSEEDEVFIGMCPELFYGGVHGDDSVEVFKELCEAVDEWVEIFKEDGTPLPAPKRTVFEMA